jgi:hypothetical protein
VASYEIQKFQGGNWVVDSIFDDQILAIDAAKAIMGGSRAPAAIRVMEESDGDAPPRLIYRQTAVDEHNNEASRAKAQTMREIEAARAARNAEKQAARAARAQKAHRPAKKAQSWAALALRLVAVAVVGISAFEALRYYVTVVLR